MEIRKASEEDLEAYYEICRDYYKSHNIFSMPFKEVREYLHSKSSEDALNALFIAFDRDLVGGALLEVKERDGKGHVRFQINHLAAESESARSALLDKALQTIAEYKKSLIKTAKVEVMLAETERDADLYLAAGFAQEGLLTSHYRHGEKVLVLGKSI